MILILIKTTQYTLPGLLVGLVVVYFALRYIFSSPDKDVYLGTKKRYLDCSNNKRIDIEQATNEDCLDFKRNHYFDDDTEGSL